MRLRLRRSVAAAVPVAVEQPDPATPWRQARWCAVDLELTGLYRSAQIIAIGAVPIEGGAVILGQAMYTLVRSAVAPRRDAVLVHKLRTADLRSAPGLDEALDELLRTLAGRVPVFHTSAVERTFLGRALRRRGLALPPDADTEVLGRKWLRARDHVAPAALSLARLAALLGQPGEDPHHALADALTTAQAFIALATHLEATGPQTVGSLQSAERDLREPPRRYGRLGPS